MFDPHIPERKVHLYKDQGGATYGTGRGERLYADTLCKGNFRSAELLSTKNPLEVTCKMCLSRIDEQRLLGCKPTKVGALPAHRIAATGGRQQGKTHAMRIQRLRAVAKGAAINGTYGMQPLAALDAFRADLLAILGEA